MTHPLANDPSLPDCLKRAFARVRWQVVIIKNDGTEVVCNCISAATRDAKIAEYADIQAVHASRGYGFRDGSTIARVIVRDITE